MNAVQQFVGMINVGNFVVLDTETTGLDRRAEVCQIAVVSAAGDVLLDTLVKPLRPIPLEATRIHGITNEMVADALPFPEIVGSLSDCLRGKNVVIYNAEYDLQMMNQSAYQRWDDVPLRFWCAMERFAEIFGDWNDYRQSFRWQKLTTAVSYYNLPESAAHTALGDALMTLAVCKAMATSQVVPLAMDDTDEFEVMSDLDDDPGTSGDPQGYY